MSSSRPVLQCCLSTAWGGLEMVAFETALRMQAHGHSVVTACPPDSPLAQALSGAGLPVCPVRRRHRYFAPFAVLRLRRELARRNCGAVLVHQLNDLWQAVPALWGRPDVRLVGVAHTFIGLRKKDFLHRWLYRRLSALVALTGRHRDNLLETVPMAPDRVSVIPNAVDIGRFNPERRDSQRHDQFASACVIGVVSRLDENKGLREAVEAAAHLRDDDIDFHMVIVGRETSGQTGMRLSLQDLIATRELNRHVTLAGHSSRIETDMASFDVLLMPSPAETFGRVLIEAMASGVPVVATAGGGVPDIIRDGVNGLLVPPGAPRAMAEALKRFARAPDLRASMGAKGLIFVRERYDTKVVDQALYRLLGLKA